MVFFNVTKLSGMAPGLNQAEKAYSGCQHSSLFCFFFSDKTQSNLAHKNHIKEANTLAYYAGVSLTLKKVDYIIDRRIKKSGFELMLCKTFALMALFQRALSRIYIGDVMVAEMQVIGAP